MTPRKSSTTAPRRWITATPPTPNGPLHVGHMAGPYIAGDVLRRFTEADGRAVLYTTGLDDHQTYVPVRGAKDGPQVQETAGQPALEQDQRERDHADRPREPVVIERDPPETLGAQEHPHPEKQHQAGDAKSCRHK